MRSIAYVSLCRPPRVRIRRHITCHLSFDPMCLIDTGHDTYKTTHGFPPKNPLPGGRGSAVSAGNTDPMDPFESIEFLARALRGDFPHLGACAA